MERKKLIIGEYEICIVEDKKIGIEEEPKGL